MERKSSRGNPHHDERGRFTYADRCKIEVVNSEEYYRNRTEERLNEESRSKEEEGRIVREVQEQSICNEADTGGCGRRERDDEGYRGTGGDSGTVRLLETADTERFSSSLEESRQSHKYGSYVDGHSAEEMSEMKMFLSEDGKTGIAVKSDGDIVCAFNSSQRKGAVKEMLAVARENGGVKMDCYGETLAQFYTDAGFEVVNRVEFNGDYVPDDGFHAMLHKNKPYVYTLKANSDSPEEARRKSFAGEYKCVTKAELQSVRTYGKDGYMDAISERDSLIKSTITTDSRDDWERKYNITNAELEKWGMTRKEWEDLIEADRKAEQDAMREYIRRNM